jgi:maltose alpha-D-glucosyltransferase/alpha-amylase
MPPLENDPLWYKDAIIYELHVRAFLDSNQDGMGDFRGLTQKLDYLQDLGVTALWLLPFSPSPWRDDGYDIADYTDVHPSYGTLRDFQNFLREAHRRDLRVITEIVMNHTSDQHPWFQRARRSPPGSKFRDFYVWSDTPDKYPEARIIFKDFETSNWSWDPVAKAYYWHRFYSHQPDLNFESPHVREAFKDIANFWLEMGVDGFRLDAIPYLHEEEGTNCENLPATHKYLRDLRSHVDANYPGRMLLAEANQWPEDAISYFGAGDECNMAFHFPLMPRLFMAIRMEDRFPVIDILQQTPAIPSNCQWAIFLRNHDELTLEMVTDEERDYMYRVYAHDRQMRINLGIRRRLAPLLGNDRRKIELLNALLFSMPGTPVLYYGDEIGMGDNVYLGDRNGVRTPMQWSPDRNAGFSRANPQKLYLPAIIDPEYHYEAVNVEAQQNNPNSLLWWMKRAIEHRKRYKAFGRGSLEFLAPNNRRVLAFVRRYENETILFVANLSRFPQHAALDLSKWKGHIAVELFGKARFPAIAEQPYVVTLGAHGYYWFSLEPRTRLSESLETPSLAAGKPVFEVETWAGIQAGKPPETLMQFVPAFLQSRRWFLGKDRTILNTELLDVIAIPGTPAHIGLLRVEYSQGEPDVYVMSAAVATGEVAARLLAENPDVVFARLQSRDGKSGVLYSAVADPSFANALLGAIARRRRIRGQFGELVASHTRAFRKVYGARPALEPIPLRADQRNTSVAFGDRFMLKLFRRVEPGMNPDIEIGAFLTERGIRCAPAVTGTIEYRRDGEAMSIGVLTAFVQNQGDGWEYTRDALGRFFEQAITRTDHDAAPRLFPVGGHIPESVHELMGEYPESARVLGVRLAELHLALASDTARPEFAPEPFTDHFRQGLYHGLIGTAGSTLSLLQSSLDRLSPEAQDEGRKVLARQEEIRALYRPIRDHRFQTQRIRIHGDLNLRQVLGTGKDWVFIDFEGQPAQTYGERRIKRHPMRDVAGLLRSMHYAALAVRFGRVPGITPKPENAAAYDAWAAFWSRWAGVSFLWGYLSKAREGSFLPQSEDDIRTLLRVYWLDRAVSEVMVELRDRPDWAIIPLRGISAILDR